MANLKESTLKRYLNTSILLKAHNIKLSELKGYTQESFKEKTGLSFGTFRLAVSLSKNDYVQKQVNEHIEKEKLESNVIQKVEIKDYSKIKVSYQDIIETPKREGQYGIVELIDSNYPSKWIKYTSLKDFKRQLNKLLESDSLEKKYDVVFHGYGKYKEYTEREFKRLVKQSV